MEELPNWENELRQSVRLGLEERIRHSEVIKLVGERLEELKQNSSPETLQTWAQILSQQEPTSFESGGDNVNDSRYLFLFFALQALKVTTDDNLSPDEDILSILRDKQYDITFFKEIIDEMEKIEVTFLEISQANKSIIASYKEALDE